MSTRLNSVELPENIQLIPGHRAEIKLKDLPNSSDCTTTMTYISVDNVEINQSCSVKTSTYQVIDSSKELVTVHQGEPSTGRIVNCPYTMTMDQGIVTVNASCKLVDLPNYVNKPQFTENPDTDIPYSYGTTYGSNYGNGSNRANGNPAYNEINKADDCPSDYILHKNFIYQIPNSDGTYSNGQYNNVCISNYNLTYPAPSNRVYVGESSRYINEKKMSGMCSNNGRAILIDRNTNTYKCVFSPQS
jgi:hypothetical protein